MNKLDIQLFADGDVVPPVETPAVKTPPVVNENTQTPVTPYKAFATEEEFDKYTQSLSSTAKGSILKDIGVANVQEAKDKLVKITELEGIQTKYTELEAKHTVVVAENELTKETLILSKYDVPETFKDHFKTLVKAGVTVDKNIEDSAKEVFESLNLTKVNNKIVIGGSSSKVEVTSKEMQDKLRKL
jgi:hypothetical protein